MKSIMQKRMDSRGQSGFTLIELLVVVAILAILGGVAVFAVGNLTDEATDSATCIELRTVKTAVEAYKADNSGDYPTVQGDIVPDWIESAPTQVSVVYGATVAVAPTYTPATCP